MSLNNPPKNKMMSGAPDEKTTTDYFFAGGGIYHAQVVRATSIDEATETYHKTKKLVHGTSAATVAELINTPDAPDEGPKDVI